VREGPELLRPGPSSFVIRPFYKLLAASYLVERRLLLLLLQPGYEHLLGTLGRLLVVLENSVRAPRAPSRPAALHRRFGLRSTSSILDVLRNKEYTYTITEMLDLQSASPFLCPVPVLSR
jgi:hypothetical protein